MVGGSCTFRARICFEEEQINASYTELLGLFAMMWSFFGEMLGI
jgi:hypothetical protein